MLLLRLKTESDAAAAATAAAEAMKKRATDVARNAARRKADPPAVYHCLQWKRRKLRTSAGG